jgi:hypothetical protein
VAKKLKPFVIEEMFDVAPRSGEKIIEASDFRALRQQAFAQV